MGFFNNNRPALADVNVRKALALAIDRPALAAATAPAGLPTDIASGMAATGAGIGMVWHSLTSEAARQSLQASADAFASMVRLWDVLKLDPTLAQRRLAVGAEFVLALTDTRCTQVIACLITGLHA